jgi:hypothetical protein
MVFRCLLSVCALHAAALVHASYGPRAGPGTTVVWPSGLPPSPPSQSIQPYVTGLSAWNGNTYSVGAPPFNYTLLPYKYSSSSCVSRASLPRHCVSTLSTRRAIFVCVFILTRTAQRRTFDTIYIFVTLSEPITVTPTGATAPTLQLATGAHFQSGAANISASFIAGGTTATKGFWLNDEPSPILSGLPQTCRADGVRYANVNGTLMPVNSFKQWSYNQDRPFNQTRLTNVSLCVPGAPPEFRKLLATSSVLAFAFDVAATHRTALLDVTSTSALSAGNYTITSAATGRSADLTLPAPSNPLMPWMVGAPGSLSANNYIVVGPPYVTNVSSDSPAGTYTNGNTLDVLVSFSEAVNVTCAAGWTQATVSMSAGAAPDNTVFSKCSTSITLQLVTAPVNATASATNGFAVLVADRLSQFDGSKVVSPAVITGGPFDPPNVLRFRYTVKAFDTTCPKGVCAALQYTSGQSALSLGSNTVNRITDGVSAGTTVALPPTNSAYSLAAQRLLLIQTRNGQG